MYFSSQSPLPTKANNMMRKRPTVLPMTFAVMRPGVKAVRLVTALDLPFTTALAGDSMATIFSCAPGS